MPHEIGICPRIRWLIGAHLVLAGAPLLGLLVEFSMQTLPLLWALFSLPIGGMMTLSVWVGMGRTRLLWRVLIGLLASFYMAVWPFVLSVETTDSNVATNWIMDYLEAVAPFSIALFLFGGVFMLMGLRYALTIVEPGATPPRTGRLQFSLLQIMVVMSVLAIVLSLLRATRTAGVGDSAWAWWMMTSFMFVVFFVNTACAAFATLGPGKVKRNIALVVVVSILLGIAVAIAMHFEEMAWWLFLGSMSMVMVPMVMVVASLLVVRSCGYRLVRRNA